MARGFVPAALVAAFVAVWAGPAAAYRVSPMIYELTPLGAGASKVVRVDNLLERAITVEIAVYARSIGPDGAETRTAADDDFIIFPPQSIVQPQTVQAFRVQYVGDPAIVSTKMYVISINQVPVATPGQGSGVQFIVNFATSVYVTPAGVLSKASVASVARADDPTKVQVRIANPGAKYAALTQAAVTVRNAAGASFTIREEALREIMGTTVVPAGGERVLLLPTPAEFDSAGALTGSLEYDPSIRPE